MSYFKPSIDSRVDYSLILPVICLLIFGIMAIYIAVNHDYPASAWAIVGQQIAWIALGIVISFVVMFFNTKFLWKITPLLYVIGGTTLFQPSEFMKISYILILSRSVVQFSQRNKDKIRTIKMDWLLILELFLYTVPVLILLTLQSDLGTALVFMAIFSGIILLSGVSWKIILPIFLMGVSLFLAFMLIFTWEGGRAFLHNLGMPTYQINRILAWLHPFEYAQTTTYQQAQGQIAIGSGGIWGQGFNVSNLLVPVRESDMIFTVIAEDFGFMGSIFLIALYLLLIYRMLRITLKSNNQFYTYISTGLTMMLIFHIFENIGAVTGLLPLTGIPLPFISQGGSSIISNLIGVGLLLSVSYQNNLLEEQQTGYSRRRKKIILKKLK